MVLSDFYIDKDMTLANPHELMPFSFNMQSILESKYSNIGKEEVWTYLVQTRSYFANN